MKQGFKNFKCGERPEFGGVEPRFSDTPNEPVDKRHLRQRLYAKRDRKNTPSGTGFIRQTKQGSSSQVTAIIDDLASLPFVPLYLNTAFWRFD
jgi:hypothetical protein